MRIKTDVPQYLLDHGRFFNHCDELQLAATWATLNVDIEHALQQPRPCHAHGFAVRVWTIARACCGLLRGRWHDLGSWLPIRREHAVKPYQV